MIDRIKQAFGPQMPGLLGVLLLVIAVFGVTAPNSLTGANLGSIAFKLPELGILTLAMLIPIISGGSNLAIIHPVNMAGLILAFVLMQFGAMETGIGPFLFAPC